MRVASPELEPLGLEGKGTQRCMVQSGLSSFYSFLPPLQFWLSRPSDAVAVICPCHRPQPTDPVPVPCSPTPAFGSAFGTPARRISLKGYISEIGRASPLRKMTSAAYGVAGRLDCERAPRALPGTGIHRNGFVQGRSARWRMPYPARADFGVRALARFHAGVGCSDADAVAVPGGQRPLPCYHHLEQRMTGLQNRLFLSRSVYSGQDAVKQ